VFTVPSAGPEVADHPGERVLIGLAMVQRNDFP